MRLIDADAFDERVRAAGGMSEEELSEDFKDGVLAVLYMMSKQPTITAQPEQSIAQERYEDLCEYFKDCSDQGRSILNDRKEFKS